MNQNIERLLTLVAAASDKFMACHKDLSTTVGLLEKNLHESSAVTIENVKLGQKLMFIILDAHPETVGIGVGATGSDEVNFIAQYSLLELNTELIMDLMEQKLVS